MLVYWCVKLLLIPDVALINNSMRVCTSEPCVLSLEYQCIPMEHTHTCARARARMCVCSCYFIYLTGLDDHKAAHKVQSRELCSL